MILVTGGFGCCCSGEDCADRPGKPKSSKPRPLPSMSFLATLSAMLSIVGLQKGVMMERAAAADASMW